VRQDADLIARGDRELFTPATILIRVRLTLDDAEAAARLVMDRLGDTTFGIITCTYEGEDSLDVALAKRNLAVNVMTDSAYTGAPIWDISLSAREFLNANLKLECNVISASK
jgi:polyisoprenoid-binding protein YceI